MLFPEHTTREAVMSEDRKYRYLLRRYLDGDNRDRKIMWIMLNPSSADHERDDPTLRKCIAFSKAWGYNALSVSNLYAYRSPHPKVLEISHKSGVSIMGPNTDEYMVGELNTVKDVVVAWGDSLLSQDRADEVLRYVDITLGRPPSCLGHTQRGNPRHPLWVPVDTIREPYYASRRR